MIDRLNELSKLDVPASLASLKTKERRFNDSIEKSDMKDYVLKGLGL